MNSLDNYSKSEYVRSRLRGFRFGNDGDSALKEIVISEGDLIGDLMKGKTPGDGRRVKAVKENGTNIVVRIIPE